MSIVKLVKEAAHYVADEFDPAEPDVPDPEFTAVCERKVPGK